MTNIIDGKKIAEKIKGEIKELLVKSKDKASLAIIYVGQNKVIESYVALKQRVGTELGIDVEVLRFGVEASEDEIISAINAQEKKYSGMIVQLPLPENFKKENILNSVPAGKDVDVLSQDLFKKFSEGKTLKLPPVVAAISDIVREYQIDLEGKKIVIVGRGALVGKPVSAWLARQNLPHEMVDSTSADTLKLLKEADVIISGAGVPSLIEHSMVKEGSILLDAGTSTSSGRILGDIDSACYVKASLVSPVPGGIGPLTVVNLFKNIFLK